MLPPILRSKIVSRALACGAFIGLLFPTFADAQSVETTRSNGGMVSSQQWIASQVGADVLAAGGNAVDAAIATGFALAVTHPTAGNIGGGGFMVVRFPNGQTTAVDFREKAPLAAFPEMWIDDNGEYSATIHHRSHMAVGVPGTVAGFDKAHRLYGRADWNDLVDPAVELAEDGASTRPPLQRSRKTDRRTQSGRPGDRLIWAAP
jgi:gamma-glutamyltranspeptidase/glutathione hydrolase